MRVTPDHWKLRWLPIKLAAFLEDMSEPDYRRWLFKRLHWTDEKPLIRPISMKIAPRHKAWMLRRDDWKYVHDSSLTPAAFQRLTRLRLRELTIDEIDDGRDEVETAVRLSLIDTALRCRLPGLLAIRIPARAMDVRPCVSLRTLHAVTARRAYAMRDDAALRKYYMTFKDFTDEVSERADLNKARADVAVRSVFAAIADAMKDGVSVSIPGFGAFKTVQRAAKTGTNPRTKQPMIIPARTAAVFHPSDKLREAVNV